MRPATYGGFGLEGDGTVPLVHPLVGCIRDARPELDLRVVGVRRGSKAQAAVPCHNLNTAVHDVEGLALFGVALAETNGLAIATCNGTTLLEACIKRTSQFKRRISACRYIAAHCYNRQGCSAALQGS